MECDAFRDDRMDVLYAEADAATARRVDEHHAACASCREEMAAWRRVRRDLAAWTVPESLGPRRAAVRGPAAWLAAAAAVLAALGAGFALSGSQLRREPGAVSLRWGSGTGAIETLLARQEARHRAEMAALRTELVTATRPAGADEALLRRVAEMLRESESRQDARTTARLAALSEEAETQRRYDLARVSAGLSYLEGKTGQDVVRTTELMGYVLQASQKK